MTHVLEAKVLDHGYIKTIESWGSDEAIVESARMSTQKGFLGWGPRCSHCKTQMDIHQERTCYGLPTEPGDEKLLRYLYENKHSTPFEFAGLVIEVQAPIAVFREWHRHRTQSYTEMSARYAPLPDLNYIPTVERLMMVNAANKQAGSVGNKVLTLEDAEAERQDLMEDYAADERSYQRALARGVPKELARMRLPVGRYSRMRAHACLRNWLAFLTLRNAPEAQWEIRQYAIALEGFLVMHYPRTMELFQEKR